MKFLIILLVIVQILINAWCIFGIVENTKTLKIILDIMDIMELEKEVKQKND